MFVSVKSWKFVRLDASKERERGVRWKSAVSSARQCIRSTCLLCSHADTYDRGFQWTMTSSSKQAISSQSPSSSFQYLSLSCKYFVSEIFSHCEIVSLCKWDFKSPILPSLTRYRLRIRQIRSCFMVIDTKCDNPVQAPKMPSMWMEIEWRSRKCAIASFSSTENLKLGSNN